MGRVKKRRKQSGLVYFAINDKINNVVKIGKTVESIKNDIKLLLNTHQGERFYRPELGINLRKYLFEVFDVDSVINIQKIHIPYYPAYKARALYPI